MISKNTGQIILADGLTTTPSALRLQRSPKFLYKNIQKTQVMALDKLVATQINLVFYKKIK